MDTYSGVKTNLYHVNPGINKINAIRSISSRNLLSFTMAAGQTLELLDASRLIKGTFINPAGIFIMIQGNPLFLPHMSLSIGHNLELCLLTKILSVF